MRSTKTPSSIGSIVRKSGDTVTDTLEMCRYHRYRYIGTSPNDQTRHHQHLQPSLVQYRTKHFPNVLSLSLSSLHGSVWLFVAL